MLLATHVVGMDSGGKDGPEIPAVSGEYRVRELWVVPGQSAYLSGASVLMIRDVVVDAVERRSYNSSWSTYARYASTDPTARSARLDPVAALVAANRRFRTLARRRGKAE